MKLQYVFFFFEILLIGNNEVESGVEWSGVGRSGGSRVVSIIGWCNGVTSLLLYVEHCCCVTSCIMGFLLCEHGIHDNT